MAMTPELPLLLPPSIILTIGNAVTAGVSKRLPTVATPGSTRPTHIGKRVPSVPAPACGVSASAGAELITAASTDPPNQHTVEVVAAAMRAHSGNAEVQEEACHVDTAHGSMVHILSIQFVEPGLVESRARLFVRRVRLSSALGPVVAGAHGAAVPRFKTRGALAGSIVSATTRTSVHLLHALDSFSVSLLVRSPSDVLTGEAHVDIATEIFGKHLAELSLSFHKPLMSHQAEPPRRLEHVVFGSSGSIPHVV